MDRIPSFLTILLVAFFSFADAQSPLTRAEVFNYQIGDELQYARKHHLGLLMQERQKVIDVWHSPNQDTVTYTFFIEVFWDQYGTSWALYDTAIKELTVTDLNDTLKEHYIDYFHPNFSGSGSNFTSFIYDTIPGTQVNEYTSFQFTPPMITGYTRTIWADSIGMVFWQTNRQSIDANLSIRYFKIGNRTFGTPLISRDKNLSDEYQQPFPVPARDMLSLDTKLAGMNYQILNQLGQEVRIGRIPPGSQIDLSGIPAGIYMVWVSDRDSRQAFKILKSDQ